MLGWFVLGFSKQLPVVEEAICVALAQEIFWGIKAFELVICPLGFDVPAPKGSPLRDGLYDGVEVQEVCV